MTNDQILDDLDYASALAREGASAPLVGGKIGLMWGCLLSVTFTMQWAIMTQTIELPPVTLFYLWGCFSIIGGLGCVVLGRESESLDGAQSVSNRIEKYVWVMFAVMMGTLGLGILVNTLFLGGDPLLFNLMVVVAFAGNGLAYGVIALMSNARWLFAASCASFVTAFIGLTVYQDPLLYLVGGIACIFTIVMPSLISIKNQQHDAA